MDHTSDMETCSVLDLLKMHSAVLDELKRRQIVRTGNNPTGDYTEVSTR
ncbi:hypothetical protein R77591_04955 [Ralstonia mannitolilytica]|uniref:Uncharacterized protein n=1 Tax=Ralstonia mannitolilytica TaxID=105219 RepID=A0AAD2ES11_9RALS|nr:hypothetical protein R77591_04955 [Ralstonia mannitolilytica]